MLFETAGVSRSSRDTGCSRMIALSRPSALRRVLFEFQARDGTWPRLRGSVADDAYLEPSALHVKVPCVSTPLTLTPIEPAGQTLGHAGLASFAATGTTQ